MSPTPATPSDEKGLDEAGVEAAAEAIWFSCRGDESDWRPSWPNEHWQRQQDMDRDRARAAITAYLEATA